MAKPRSKKEDDPDPIRYLVGSPEPTAAYVDAALTRLWKKVWPVIVAVLALYFLYGP